MDNRHIKAGVIHRGDFYEYIHKSYIKLYIITGGWFNKDEYM